MDTSIKHSCTKCLGNTAEEGTERSKGPEDQGDCCEILLGMSEAKPMKSHQHDCTSVSWVWDDNN